ncbi:hypothetical protein BHE74_00012693 [Ensete ventricosum]|nr:hypothetical protein BHE74_00012693 [Ensete ventricosum]
MMPIAVSWELLLKPNKFYATNRHYRNTVARRKFVPWPIEIKFCETDDSAKQSQPRLKYWLKARGNLSDDPALHRYVVANLHLPGINTP